MRRGRTAAATKRASARFRLWLTHLDQAALGDGIARSEVALQSGKFKSRLPPAIQCFFLNGRPIYQGFGESGVFISSIPSEVPVTWEELSSTLL